jgi:hypothetical protein
MLHARFTTVAGKLLASAAVLGSTAAVAAYGTYGTFTASTSASSDIASGTVALSLGAAGATNRLSVAASGLVAGDTVQRNVDLINSGDQDLASIALTTTAPVTSSLLDTDTTMGLQLNIDRCSTAWTEAGSAPAYTYTCGATSSVVLASTPVIMSAAALSNLTTQTAGNTDYLRVTFTLPTGADNTLQTLSSVVDLNFTGIQRAATDK